MGSRTYTGVLVDMGHGRAVPVESPWTQAQAEQVAGVFKQLGAPSSSTTVAADQDSENADKATVTATHASIAGSLGQSAHISADLDQAVQTLVKGLRSNTHGNEATNLIVDLCQQLPSALEQGRLVGNLLQQNSVTGRSNTSLLKRLMAEAAPELVGVLGSKRIERLLAISGTSNAAQQTGELLSEASQVIPELGSPAPSKTFTPAGNIIQAIREQNVNAITEMLSRDNGDAIVQIVASQGKLVRRSVEVLMDNADPHISGFALDVLDLLDTREGQGTTTSADPRAHGLQLDQASLISIGMAPNPVGALLSLSHGNVPSAHAAIVQAMAQRLTIAQ